MTWVVPANYSHTVTYGAACSTSAFYFVETDSNMDSDADGNGSQARPNSSSGGGAATKCQSSTLAPVLITNNGNIAANIDGNFMVDLNGTDVNVVLKVWMGTGAGCGEAAPTGGGDVNGMGGWRQDCNVANATTAVTKIVCRQFNQSNETTAGRLVTSLGINDTNQLCFSGDFNGMGYTPTSLVAVPQGSHAIQIQVGSN
ncbi:MAG: hypothetical protein Q7S92_02025 [Candidatus Diapherotrites archaeon]|nr:hypothetical protein [Candidatus Diapherotrites archaeon]